MAKRRIFVDIDGTLAKWQSANDDDLMAPGFFAGMEQNSTVVEAVKILHGTKEVEVFSLSAVLPSIYERAKNEKNDWLDRIGIGLDSQHRLFCPCGTDKSACVPNGIGENDVLLDDYTFNLNLWSKSGGKGIKLINGVNGTKGSWKGPKVTMFQSPISLAQEILAIATA